MYWVHSKKNLNKFQIIVNVASYFLSSMMETKFNFEADFLIVLLNNITLEADNLEREGEQFMCLRESWM